jgi:Spx/MgsR family transcriptional regulator
MSKVEFFGYSRCSSCRDAEALLSTLDVDYVRRDLFSDPLSPEEAKSLFVRIGLSPFDVLSTRSRPYRELHLSGRELSEPEVLELMSRYPALIRRPIVVRGNKAVIGLRPNAIEELLG